MATPTSQRVGIWIIAVVMLIGTIGSFAVMVLATQNDKKDQIEQQKLIEEYQKQLQKEQEESDKLSETYYPNFKDYESSPSQFDPKKVGDKITKNDIKVGDGEEIKEGDNYVSYYIGWNPDGEVFDSSFQDGKLKAPLDTTDPQLGGPGGVIKGWQEGVIGMKVGGIRELTVPSDLAYGEQGMGEKIQPNTPLKFIMYVIEKK